MLRKVTHQEWFWILLSLLAFILISLTITGSQYRKEMDFESDITLLRFMHGDIWALFVKNRSPVLQFSLPYGGWPFLHTLMQSLWLPLHISIPYCRLFTGMTAIFMFSILVCYLVRYAYPNADIALIFMMALISPITIDKVSLGVGHILIPLAAITPLLLLFFYDPMTKFKIILFYCIALIIGFTDWQAYFIIPATGLYLISFIFHKNMQYKIKIPIMLKCLLSISMGFITAFIVYKFLLNYAISHDNNILYTVSGASANKLLARMIVSPKYFIIALGLSFVRLAFAILPVLILWIYLKIAKCGNLTINLLSPIGRVILILSILSPLLWCVIFPGHVGIEYHNYQILAFLTPVTLFLAQFSLANEKKNVIRALFFVTLVGLSLFTLKAQIFLPDNYIRFVAYNPLGSPLPPDNYKSVEMQVDSKQLSIDNIIRGIVKQITSLPLTDTRLSIVNSYNSSINKFELYSTNLKKDISEDELVIYFGSIDFSFIYYTGRAMVAVNNFDELSIMLTRLGKSSLNYKIAILIPYGSSLNFLTNQIFKEYKILSTDNIGDDGFQCVHLMLNNKQEHNH